MPIKAFILDLDGTLIDVFPAYEEAFRYAFRSAGKIYRKGSLDKYYGQVDLEIIRQMLKKDMIDEDVEHIASIKRGHFLMIAREHVKILPYAIDLIMALKRRDIKIAIATSGQRAAADIGIDGLGVREIVSAIVTAQDVKNGKPAPDLFLKAAEDMNISPNECAVVEDSIHGIRAAKSAGMWSIAVATGKTLKSDLKKESPDVLVKNLIELMPHLDGIVNPEEPIVNIPKSRPLTFDSKPKKRKQLKADHKPKKAKNIKSKLQKYKHAKSKMRKKR